MTLLTIVQNSCNAIGLSQPAAVVGSTDQNIITLQGMANTEGRELLDRFSWPATQLEVTHTSLAAELQGVMTTLAPGYSYITSSTFWDRTLTQPVRGPLSPIEWQALKARTATGPYASYRIFGGKLYAYPAPPGGNTWVFEYQSNYFCQSSSGTNQSIWIADTDVGVLDEHLMEMGIIWRFKKKNGLDYSEDFRSYEQKLAMETSRAGGRPILDMTGSTPTRGVYIPEGSWA
jgi:hypothetical protein